ncbi:MAG: MmgE/PrpD family protein [Pseudomonadota bacterium]
MSTDDDLAGALLARVHATAYEDIPADVRHAVKRHLLDTLAVGWAASDADAMQAVRDTLPTGAQGAATLWASGGRRVDAQSAALANGSLAAALDFDTVHQDGGVHADAAVVPAALALAQQHGRSGRALIRALALGSELVCRLAGAAQEDRGWFLSSVHGVFGASLAGALLLELDAQRTRHALGIAQCNARGSHQSHIERRLTKRLLTAFAARDGVLSAQLAAGGVTGPWDFLNGRFGLQALYGPLDRTRLLHGFGEDYRLLGTTVKVFPVCLFSAAPLAAALARVVDGPLAATDIEAVEVELTPHVSWLIGGDFEPGDAPQVAAQFSVRYGIACVLLRGGLGLADIEAPRVRDAEVGALARRIVVRTRDDWTGQFAPATVHVTTRNGHRWSRQIDRVPGGPEAPLSDAALHAKARQALGHGPAALRDTSIDLLIERIDTLDRLDDVAALFDGLLPAAG